MPGLSLSVSESQPDMIFVKKLTRPVMSEVRMLRKNRVNRDIVNSRQKSVNTTFCVTAAYKLLNSCYVLCVNVAQQRTNRVNFEYLSHILRKSSLFALFLRNLRSSQKNFATVGRTGCAKYQI